MYHNEAGVLEANGGAQGPYIALTSSRPLPPVAIAVHMVCFERPDSYTQLPVFGLDACRHPQSEQHSHKLSSTISTATPTRAWAQARQVAEAEAEAAAAAAAAAA